MHMCGIKDYFTPESHESQETQWQYAYLLIPVFLIFFPLPT